MQKNVGIKEIFLILKHRLLLILAITLISGLIGAFISHYLITPQYGASTRILVNQAGGKFVYNSNAVQTNVQLVNTYSELINDPIILNQVIKKLGLHMTADQMNGMLDVSTNDNSQIFSIQITSDSPEQSVQIVNGVATVFKDQVRKMMKVDNVSLLSPATVDQSWKISPSVSKNVTIATVLGLLLSIGLAFLLEYLDNSVKEEEDVTERLGLPVVGLISHIPNRKTRGRERHSTRHNPRGHVLTTRATESGGKTL
ncbi:capsule biosynthesis protein [Sporolactobacillus sp. THM7-4]|nr:capsule biosynthesis protein [Sporolactobacillus sp. THM7-4]